MTEPQKHILLVEDSRTVSATASKLLESNGYKVTTLVSFSEFWAFCKMEGLDTVDVIITDLSMGSSRAGLRVAAEVHCRNSKIPVFLNSTEAIQVVLEQRDVIKGVFEKKGKEGWQGEMLAAVAEVLSPVTSDEAIVHPGFEDFDFAPNSAAQSYAERMGFFQKW